MDKSFRVRPAGEVMEDIELAGRVMPDTRRVFLADGNALILSNNKLMAILDGLNSAFVDLQRIGIYGNARDILRKSDEELKELRAKKLSIIYIGLESGSDEILQRVKKGVTSEETVEAVKRAQNAGFKVSVIGLLGLGGADLWREHAVATGKAVSAMNPLYFSMLTLMIVRGTELHKQWKAGDFALPAPLDMLREMRVVLENIDVESGCIFRTNHASNYLPLAGRLPNDKEKLLKIVDDALSEGEEGLRPEVLRGL
jgi:radical SAM superfamily enzyme YgiQ (UPF0313 family)